MYVRFDSRFRGKTYLIIVSTQSETRLGRTHDVSSREPVNVNIFNFKFIIFIFNLYRPPTNVLTVYLSREFSLSFPKTVLQAHRKLVVYYYNFFFDR